MTESEAKIEQLRADKAAADKAAADKATTLTETVARAETERTAALQLANQWAVLPPENLEAFAMTELADLDAAFEQSFQVFEQYQRDVAAWDARYGAEYGAAYGVYPNAQPTVQPTVQSIGVGQDISSAGNADEAVQ